jgi:hypothetical protein
MMENREEKIEKYYERLEKASTAKTNLENYKNHAHQIAVSGVMGEEIVELDEQALEILISYYKTKIRDAERGLFILSKQQIVGSGRRVNE